MLVLMYRIFSVLLVITWIAGDGDKEGRTGNRLYAEEQYARAAEAYQHGLAALSENAPRMLRYGLLNNLGAALLKSGDADAAGDAFSRALASAPERTDVARTSYNAGNAAFAGEDLETALEHYRQSLLADPENEDAKFNYEFVKRRLDQMQQNQPDQGGQQNNQNESEQERNEEDGSQNQQQDQDQDQNQPREDDEEGQGGRQDEQDSEQQRNEEREGQPDAPPSGSQMSEEQAQQILDALRAEEEQLLREVQRPKSRPRQVDKDW